MQKTAAAPGEPGEPKDNPSAKRVFELITRSAEEQDGENHSLCRFCSKRGTDSCLHGSNRKGLCVDFAPAGTPDEIDRQVIDYLTQSQLAA